MKTTSKIRDSISALAAIVWQYFAYASAINSSMYGRMATAEELEMLGRAVDGAGKGQKIDTQSMPAVCDSSLIACRSDLIACCCCP